MEGQGPTESAYFLRMENMNARNYKTAKGTELPLLNLKGREYLEVKYRLVWFREDHPDWSIETELNAVTDSSAYAKAVVKDEHCRTIATSHKFESVQGFPDFIEKAETGAIGRALALIGYGTQFCADELDEGSRIVDAPVSRSYIPSSSAEAATTSTEESEASDSAKEEASKDPGDFLINFGRKYKGKRLKEISRTEMEGYLKWLEESSLKSGTSLSFQVEHLKRAMERYYSSTEAPAPVAHAH
jgi:hypothetical protein